MTEPPVEVPGFDTRSIPDESTRTRDGLPLLSRRLVAILLAVAAAVIVAVVFLLWPRAHIAPPRPPGRPRVEGGVGGALHFPRPPRPPARVGPAAAATA